MATSPGNSATGASSRCTIRHLVDAVCKIRRQKQCATTARIHKAVRQQLQRNVEVEEVLEQLNVATSTGELWRVDNNGVTSYREPPKGTSKEHLKWSADKHARWPSKDQQSGQFMMGHVKYPQNEHLNQPVNDHLAQRAHEHLPWMAEPLRSSTAEPLRDHMMEPSRCSMNEPFMWPMSESMRWPAMNDPMSWSTAEPLRQASVENVPQQRSETTSWSMNEPFRRPSNDPLGWQMNQSLRGQMAEQFAWHVTEPLRHPMVDPLTWPVPEPLRRPMTEQLPWPGNDQLRRSIPEPLGWPVATPESFRRPTPAEHFNWCSPDAVRQTAKDTYAKPVKDTTLSSRNLSSDISTVWPTRDAASHTAAHNSTKALSRSITNSQKDSYKGTSSSTFAFPASQSTMDTGVLPHHKNRSISPSSGNTNNKFQSLPQPGPCKDLNNSCAELQRTCKQLPNVRKDVRLRDGMSQFGAAQNHYQPSSHSTGEVAMIPNGQGFCLPQDVQYSCLSNCSGNSGDGKPHALESRRPPLALGNEVAPQIPNITPVGSKQHGHSLESSYTRKNDVPNKCEEDGKAFRLDKRLDPLDILPISGSTASRMSDEVLQVARSLFEDSKTEKFVAEQQILSVEADSSTVCHNLQSVAMHQNPFLSAVEKAPGDTLLPSLKTTAAQLVPKTGNEQMSLDISAYKVESTEMKFPLSEEIDPGNCTSGGYSDPTAKVGEQCASFQALTSSLDCMNDLCQSSVNCLVKDAVDDQKPFSEDLLSNKESVVIDNEASDHLETTTKSILDAESQIVKCIWSRRNRKQASRKTLLNCNSFNQVSFAVPSAAKKMCVNGDIVTPHRIKLFLLSKYKISSCSVWLLRRRILQCFPGAFKFRLRKRKKKRLRIQSSSADKDRFSLAPTDDPYCGSVEIPSLAVATQMMVNESVGCDVKGVTSEEEDLPSSGPCLLTDENQASEMCQSVKDSECSQEEVPCQPDSSSSDLSAHDVGQEVEMATEATPNYSVHAVISPLIRQSGTNETPIRSSQDKLNEADNVSPTDCLPVADNQTDGNPKGLIDGLTRFFTPSNKRNSRVSRNTLQRTLEQMAKSRTSPKKKRLLSQVSKRRQKMHQPQAEGFKATTASSLNSGILKLDDKNHLLHKKTPGRRREQLQDGLSHFFAVEGKRRSCTLGRLLADGNCSYSSRCDLPVNERAVACSHDVRSRTRSLSLSDTRDWKALSSKKQQISRTGDPEPDLCQPNVSRRGMLFHGKRRSRTLSASTQSSQRSALTLDCAKSPSSTLDRRLAEDPDTVPVADLTMSMWCSYGRSLDAVHLRNSLVPSSMSKTTCVTSDHEKLLNCESISSLKDSNKLSSLSFYSKFNISSLCTSFASGPTAGRSAMVKLARLSSEDSSVLTYSGGSAQFEIGDTIEYDDLPVNEASTGSEGNSEDLVTEQPTTIDMAEAHRVVQPSMTPHDLILFRKAQKIAAERILVTHELNNLDPCQPNPPCIQFGQYELTTSFSSLYPPEFARLPKLFICEFCLKYLKSQSALQLHMAKCRQICPPGNEIYRADDLSVFEVSGDVSPVYCQNICLLARLFVGSKSPVQFNMSPFLFYILTRSDLTGSHLIGYFAKEKYSSWSTSVSIVNLLVLPQHRKMGYGDFLIQFSYLICRLNKNPGSPLRPLSPESSKVFHSNWCKNVAECLKTYLGPEQQITIRDISLQTGIHPNDILSTLSSLRLIDRTRHDLGTFLSVSNEAMDELQRTWVLPYVDKRIRIDLKLLRWTKSSVQHILKTSLDSEKLSKVIRRKSARKLQPKRTDYGVPEVQASIKEYENHCELEGQDSLARTAKRKTESSSDVSPSKSFRLSSPESVNVADERLLYDDRFETSEEEPNVAWSTNSEIESVFRMASCSERTVTKRTKLNQNRNCGNSSLLTDAVSTSDSLSESHHINGSREVDHRARIDGAPDCGNWTQQEPVSEAGKSDSKNVAEKKSVRSVAVQTDAYESDSSDDESDESSSSSGSCSNCCNTSDESDIDESGRKSPSSSLQPAQNASLVTESPDAVKELVVKKNDENKTEIPSSANEVSASSPVFSVENVSDSTVTAASIDRPVEESLLNASCEALNQGIIGDLLTPESLDRVPEQMTQPSDKSGTSAQNNTIQLTEAEEESSQQLFDFQDSNKESTYAKGTEFDTDNSHPTFDEADFQSGFSKIPADTGKESECISLASQHGSQNEYVHHLHSETTAVSENFQFSATHPGSAPNLAIESPLSMNSSSELGNCNVERTPSSQAFSDCAQAQNPYNMENVGASPACGFLNSQPLGQMTSPGGNSQITSPVSNHSFNITRCSPAIGNGPGYSSTSEVATSQQLNLSNQHPANGSTFKMPVEDNRFAPTSSAYPVNGLSAAMASPASLGQCSYMGQYAEQSPVGQCNVINQNSPNGLGYNMPTPSPTNSSSRSFNMVSPNTNAYHGQPSGPHSYDRSCPSAPVLSYARVLPQQLSSATDSVPWTHIYPPQAAGYSLIKFPDQELVPQHAVALPRNLLPSQSTVAVQQHLTQVNLVPLPSKPAKCSTASSLTTNKQHRRCGKSCKSSTGSGLSMARSQTVAPNVTIQPGTNMITSYNVINMNVDYRAQHPPIAAYPSNPYISNAAFINDAQQMQSLNIYQHRAISFPRQPQSHNNVYTAAYGYINGAIAQQSFNINVNGIMRQ